MVVVIALCRRWPKTKMPYEDRHRAYTAVGPMWPIVQHGTFCIEGNPYDIAWCARHRATRSKCRAGRIIRRET